MLSSRVISGPATRSTARVSGLALRVKTSSSSSRTVPRGSLQRTRGYHCSPGSSYHQSSPNLRATTSSSDLDSLVRTGTLDPVLRSKLAQFIKDVETYLPIDGKGVAIATAWLNTDNLITALLAKFFPNMFEGVQLVAVDTLHLFPETLAVADAIQTKYNKKALITKPLHCETRADFDKLNGKAVDLSAADFEYHSKVEPFQRALKLSQKAITITGRRVDQGSQRVAIDVWEEDKHTFNPLTDWTWEEVTTLVDALDIPYNKLHNVVYVAEREIPATERHLNDLPWKSVNLGKPYWQTTLAEFEGLKHGNTDNVVYVWKSFGDVHTSVTVRPEESERSGRFVLLNKTECGIHTRATVKSGQPHGGILVDLLETEPAARAEIIASCNGRELEVDERIACDLELLINGGFSPLRGFMNEDEYNSVVNNMRLPELQLWGIPIVFHTDREDITVGDHVLLKHRNEFGEMQQLAVLKVNSKWIPDKVLESNNVFGTTKLEHPGVKEIALERGKYYLGGEIVGLEFPKRKHIAISTPREVRKALPKGKKVVAFQCRNPIHRAHFELFTRVPDQIEDSVVLVHPTCGPTQDGDIDWRLRFLTYEALQELKPNPAVYWAYLPYSMHMGGPREAIQHMIIRKNFGATHFIIGRDMAGCKSSLTQEDFYGPYEAQDFAHKYESELGVDVVPFKQLVYTKEKGFVDEDEAKELGLKALKLSGTEFRRRLRSGEEIPDWFSFAPVVDILRKSVAVMEE